MTTATLRPLQASDATALRQLISEQYLAQLHPLDQCSIAPAMLRRRLARRYRRDVIATTQSLGIFHGAELRAAALYGDGVHPITQVHERQILDLVAVCADPALLETLLSNLIHTAQVEGSTQLYLEVNAHGPGSGLLALAKQLGFGTHHLILRRVVGPRILEPGRFGLTTRSQRAFALHCITQGLINGLNTSDETIGAQVDRFVAQRFQRLQTQQRLSIVALDDHDQPCAHALVELVPAALRPSTEARLLDIFVPAAWKGEGWSIRLWRYVEHVLYQRGIDRAEGTLVFNGATVTPELVVSLEQEGWWIDRHVLMRQLR